MRKFALLCVLMAGMLSLHAKNPYPYLTFETTDGAKFSVSVSSLNLSVKGNVLTAGEHEFVISNLSKMYFSAVSESTTGIDAATGSVIDEAAEIYDLNGRVVPQKALSKGVYIVKMKNGVNRIVVR